MYLHTPMDLRERAIGLHAIVTSRLAVPDRLACQWPHPSLCLALVLNQERLAGTRALDRTMHCLYQILVFLPGGGSEQSASQPSPATMASSSRRSKQPSPLTDCHDSDFTSTSRKKPHPSPTPPVGNPPISHMKIKSALSTHFLTAAATEFTPQQRAIVNDAGFGFILHLAQSLRTSRPFAVWLLAHVQRQGPSLVFRGIENKVLERSSVEDILMIPGGPTPVRQQRPLGADTSSSCVKEVEQVAGYGLKKLTRSISKAKSVIESLQGIEEMSPDDINSFRAAVVVYAVGKFLAPRGESGGEVEEDIVDVLLSGGDLKTYDWQGYTLTVLAEGAASLREQLLQGCQRGKIALTGCTTLLMVSISLLSRSCSLHCTEPIL